MKTINLTTLVVYLLLFSCVKTYSITVISGNKNKTYNNNSLFFSFPKKQKGFFSIEYSCKECWQHKSINSIKRKLTRKIKKQYPKSSFSAECSRGENNTIIIKINCNIKFYEKFNLPENTYNKSDYRYYSRRRGGCPSF